MKKRNRSVTIGIPTYYGDKSLIKTVDSIVSSKKVEKPKIIITVDGKQLTSHVRNALLKRGVKLVESTVRKGQAARIKQLISLSDTDILVLAQDDVLFDSYALSKISSYFATHSKMTMVGARVYPMKANTFFENVVETGVHLTHTIGENWKRGDNYLLSSGRCLAFRTAFIKTFYIPSGIINSDAYLYFENKKRGGKFVGLRDAVIYNRSPQTTSENLRQSKKFLVSKRENEKYFIDLSEEYDIPFSLKCLSFLQVFLKNPLYSFLYTFVYLSTRIKKHQTISLFWQTDISTKRV